MQANYTPETLLKTYLLSFQCTSPNSMTFCNTIITTYRLTLPLIRETEKTVARATGYDRAVFIAATEIDE
jgi:hypothetical protein